MADSEAQFQELLAHLVARAERILSKQDNVPPLSLALKADGSMAVAVGVADTPDGLAEVLGAMQASLKQAATREAIEAVCVAYPDYQNQAIVALLENRENDCVRASFPVVKGPSPRLDLDNMQVDDSEACIFPVAGAT